MKSEHLNVLAQILTDGLTRVQNKADFYSIIDYDGLNTLFDLAHKLKTDYNGLDLSEFYSEYHRVFSHLVRQEERQKIDLKNFRKYEYIPWN